MGVARLVGFVKPHSGTPTILAHQQSSRRSMGFFSDLKKNIQDEVDKNKELKEALGNLQKKDKAGAAKAEPSSDGSKQAEEAMKAAQENFAKATDEPQSSQPTVVSPFSPVQSKEQASEALGKASKAFGDFFGAASEATSKAREATAKVPHRTAPDGRESRCDSAV